MLADAQVVIGMQAGGGGRRNLILARLLHIDCGDMHLWKCGCPDSLAIGKGNACIVQKNSLLEYGHVVMELNEAVKNIKELPVVLRRATLQDETMANENILLSKNALRLCQEKLDHYKLPMCLVRVHYSFDRSQLLVVFTSEERCDTRQLVYDLAEELHVHIEMKQIGVRDMAAVRGGLAPCGRIICCKSWMQKFDNVHVSFAKNQGVPLRQSSINGMCGRLKCCLRFEYFSAYKKHAES
jgi:cell fate regulator YaaT (PSP1 superfamily)